MVLSGCHSFSDTCSERQLPCPLLLRNLSDIYLPFSSKTLASGALSFRDPGWFLVTKDPWSLLSKLQRGGREGTTSYCVLTLASENYTTSWLCGLGKTAEPL